MLIANTFITIIGFAHFAFPKGAAKLTAPFIALCGIFAFEMALAVRSLSRIYYFWQHIKNIAKA
ncbi:MAG: hypothetical protein NC253_00810 [Ruminococcus sp.]|nr:hypothetical protein [Ruminococcus sp.]MCM1380831.1 hypothetical protein [Muribaculaceae bacterium]MCM1480021.1 hypothetical protein [Muribaculaceae bacterium]